MGFIREGFAALTGKGHVVSPILEDRFEKLAKDAQKKSLPRRHLN